MELPAPEDMRGMTVRDRHGLIAGRVVDLYLDGESGVIRYMSVAVGPGIRGQVLVPLDEVEATSDPLDVELRVPFTRAEVRSAPVCADGQMPTVRTEIDVRRHFAQAEARSDALDLGVAGGADADPADLTHIRTVRWGT